MKTEKMRIAEKVRSDCAKKWDEFFLSGESFTEDKKRELQEDNERIRKLCDEATREWLQSPDSYRKKETKL